jgi:predicted GNAT family N-acyltransferase
MSAEDGQDAVAPFRAETVDYAVARDDLHAVRDAVFVREQQVPVELEHDDLDPGALHVLARTLEGEAIGAGRLAPPRPDLPAKIGRMAVLRAWRGRGVGAAMLAVLLREARQRGWHEVVLHAQATAVDFYLRHGFAPEGPRFSEAGIEHQAMRLAASAPVAVGGPAQAVEVATAIARGARRVLCFHLREPEPALLEAPVLLDALRAFAVAGHGGEIRFLLQQPETPPRGCAALLALARRLPSAFEFRAAGDPVDVAYPSAYVVNDAGGYYFRTLAARVEGEAGLASPGRARQLRTAFERVWERSCPLTEYRALRL